VPPASAGAKEDSQVGMDATTPPRLAMVPQKRLNPPHHGEPRFWPALTERDVLQVGSSLESRRRDGFDHPALGKSSLP
jgi:hypothetical protein